MIVVVGRVKTDADKRAELLRVATAVAAASRAEEGCIDYRVYADVENEHELVFVEEWESDEALKAHFAEPHLADFMRAVPATLAAPPQASFHTVASTRDLTEVGAG
jgi:quinol monooxygenase YgiN